MRPIPISFLFILFCSFAFAQTEKLPDILKPDAASEAEAQRMGAKVFKLLPYEMFNTWPGPASTKDEDYPLRIRGSGNNYSFTNESHSYNKGPEIDLYGPLRLSSALGEIAFFADLGNRDLSTVDSASAEAEFFLKYRLPKYRHDLNAERTKFSEGVHESGLLFRNSIYPVSQGDSYLLRSIITEKSDIFVAFQILRIDRDGSWTIAWKKLADFPKPIVLWMSDEELQSKVDAIIAEENIIGVNILVKDNDLYSLGPNHRDAGKVEATLVRRGINFRGAGGEIRNLGFEL